MAYSDIVLDHFQQPRNVGELEGADAVAEDENPVCGDRIRLSLRIRDGIIADVRWQGEGCVPALAAASMATELIRGRSPGFGPLLDESDLDAALGGVPPRKAHAVSMVVSAVNRASEAFLANRPMSSKPPVRT